MHGTLAMNIQEKLWQITGLFTASELPEFGRKYDNETANVAYTAHFICQTSLCSTNKSNNWDDDMSSKQTSVHLMHVQNVKELFVQTLQKS
jgi:hypothetical protein